MSHLRRQDRGGQIRPSTVVRAAVLALGFMGMSAHAEWRCDCTTILDTCSATVTVEDDSVLIQSGHRQCARVDYLIDGLPFVALVVEGREQQSWLNRNDNPRVLMQSCRVCLDKADDRSPVATLGARTVEFPEAQERTGEVGISPDEDLAREQAPSRDAELSPLIVVNPRYPSSAGGSSGADGFVEVSFAVTALGRVEDAIVTAAEPPGVFEQAALAAISRWRYNADGRRQPVTLTHRFDFRAEAAAVSPSAPGRAAETVIDALIASSAARRDGFDAEVAVSEPKFAVRNRCIREQASYDFGEMVDVNLMNTCSEPLLVYSCAEGMGRYQRRWVCQSTEATQSILVRPGDRLAGNVAMIEVPQGIRTFKYSQDLFVARARNTEYWWLACNVDDAECRGSGRQWARSMDGKPVSVDPQLWTEQAVARSY